MPLVLQSDTNPGTASFEELADLIGDAGLGVSSVVKQRVQQSDLPASTVLTLTFGGPVAANTVVNSVLLYFNTDIDVGASGITDVTVSLGITDVATQTKTRIMVENQKLLGPEIPAAPSYFNGFNTDEQWRATAVSVPEAFEYVIAVSSVGANLDQLVAFDLTAFFFQSSLVLDVP